MEVNVKLKKMRLDQDGTTLVIQAINQNLVDYIMQHNVSIGMLWLPDGRMIYPDQRKKAYAMERDIAEFCGYLSKPEKEYVHDELKADFCRQYKEPWFSLSNCSVSTARAYITFLIDFALENGVPLEQGILERTDDIDAALISCIRKKKCCLCGRSGEIHHIDAIGMGHNRKIKDDSGSRIICLCRKHHTEAHTIGRESFQKKYKVYGIERYRTEGRDLCT